MNDVSVLIIGGGLAGTHLAARLISEGRRVHLLDAPDKTYCSRRSIGLVNPAARSQSSLTWFKGQPLAAARERYLQYGQKWKSVFWHDTCLRALVSQPLNSTGSWLQQSIWSDPLPGAGVVDVNLFLDTLHSLWISEGLMEKQPFRPESLRVTKEGILYHDGTYQFLVFCTGHDLSFARFFPEVQIHPVGGSWLRVAHPMFDSGHTWAGRMHLSPHPAGYHALGATYRPGEITTAADLDDRVNLITQGQLFTDGTLQTVEAIAGTRPATRDRIPVLGCSSMDRRIILCNGMGSMGAVLAPLLADAVTEFICSGRPLPLPLSPFRWSSLLFPNLVIPAYQATDLVRKKVTLLLRPGDKVVDATLGNGLDAAWLLSKIHPGGGHLFGCDIQPESIALTRSRLAPLGFLPSSSLFHCCHGKLHFHLPPELFGRLKIALFNLGYRPGGNHDVVTRTETTLSALESLLPWLIPGGCVALVVYPGHKEGAREKSALLKWSKEKERDCLIRREYYPQPPRRNPAPEVLFLWKKLSSKAWA